jgi:predicted Fe-Mo cluster-binding NifX family protein
MKIAAPAFGDEVAPCFEAASRFEIFHIDNADEISHKAVSVQDNTFRARKRMLKTENAEVLICSGISSLNKDILEAEGVIVIDKITGNLDTAIDNFLNLKQIMDSFDWSSQDNKSSKPLNELISWIAELFRRNSFIVRSGSGETPFPVDLTVETKCRICGKRIRAAVCCGSHTHSAEKEIKELYFAAGKSFDALIYVHRKTPNVRRICSDYQIQLLDPNTYFNLQEEAGETASLGIPLLKEPVKGHEKCLQAKSE